MEKSMAKMAAVAVTAALGAAGAFAAPPNVSNVTLTQPSFTRSAVVSYTIDSAGVATFLFKTGGVDIVHSEIVRSVSGDINQYVGAGTHSFTWDAGRDFPERLTSNLTVVVTLWATNNPPTYCAVNLVETGGQYPVRWYGSSNEVPWGVTDSRWKKDWLLLRLIPSMGGSTVTLGSPANEFLRAGDGTESLRSVSITQPFYVGVYPVTQRQWEDVGVRSKPSKFNNTTDWEERPVEQVTYNEIRGATSSSPAVDWPLTDHDVLAMSFLGKLRAKTGDVLAFDLPTDAQWEYACRAGTTGPWNNGIGGVNNAEDPNLNLLGRNQYNGGKIWANSAWQEPAAAVTASNATAKVGSYLPNAWGLYDMHGNVWEMCLDWYTVDATDATLSGDNPKGPLTGSKRMLRGGPWPDGATNARSARRGGDVPTVWNHYIGFRVAAPAEVLVGEVEEVY
jgi:formylglycine-generating enzyme required for sulfatase activity